MPSDARGLVTVGAADLAGQPAAFSSPGPPIYLELLTKPDALAFDRLGVETGAGPIAFGSGLSNAFAAGQAAVLLSGHMPSDEVERLFHSQKGKLLRLP